MSNQHTAYGSRQSNNTTDALAIAGLLPSLLHTFTCEQRCLVAYIDISQSCLITGLEGCEVRVLGFQLREFFKARQEGKVTASSEGQLNDAVGDARAHRVASALARAGRHTTKHAVTVPGKKSLLMILSIAETYTSSERICKQNIPSCGSEDAARDDGSCDTPRGTRVAVAA